MCMHFLSFGIREQVLFREKEHAKVYASDAPAAVAPAPGPIQCVSQFWLESYLSKIINSSL